MTITTSRSEVSTAPYTHVLSALKSCYYWIGNVLRTNQQNSTVIKTSIPSCPTMRFVIRRNLKSNRVEFQIESHHCELCILSLSSRCTSYYHSMWDSLTIQTLFSFQSTKPLLFHQSICCSGLNSSNRISLNLPYTWYLGRHWTVVIS